MRFALRLAALVVLTTRLPGQTADSLPPTVTPEMVTRGKVVYNGTGLCMACHGPTGKGGLGPDLTDTTWLHHDGNYDALVKQITEGIDEKISKSGQIMPARGGSGLSDADVRAVAAYTWTLSKH